jgi:pyruvate formate lyase activating enzyme
MLNKTIQCRLCPKECRIGPGERGDCRGRVNIGGKLTAIAYGHPCSIHVDPVEKKPLFHFLPGTSILSIAAAGCILHCKNCQNWQISQTNPEDITSYDLPSQDIVRLSIQERCSMIAYTYTDPIAFFEYTLDTAIAARDAGLRNVMVTCGYANSAPLKKLYNVSDAINTDLKFMHNDLYRKITTGSLQPVLDGMIQAKQMKVWLEVTHLIIPTLNDSTADLHLLCQWMHNNLGPDTPLHFSRFYPQYLMRNLPETPVSTLEKAYDIAKEVGINYVYIGNVWGSKYENTYCPDDGTLLIRRTGYRILENNITAAGTCPRCGKTIAGIWK